MTETISSESEKKPKSYFIVASLVLFLGALQVYGCVRWHQPWQQVFFEMTEYGNPLVIALIAFIVCRKTGKVMPWWGIAFDMCGLTPMGIILLPYTLGILHISVLAKAVLEKNYYTILLVPIVFGGVWIGHHFF